MRERLTAQLAPPKADRPNPAISSRPRKARSKAARDAAIKAIRSPALRQALSRFTKGFDDGDEAARNEKHILHEK